MRVRVWHGMEGADKLLQTEKLKLRSATIGVLLSLCVKG